MITFISFKNIFSLIIVFEENSLYSHFNINYFNLEILKSCASYFVIKFNIEIRLTSNNKSEFTKHVILYIIHTYITVFDF